MIRLSGVHHHVALLSILSLLVILPWCDGLSVGSWVHQQHNSFYLHNTGVEEAQTCGPAAATAAASRNTNGRGRREAVRKLIRVPAVAVVIASTVLSSNTAAVARNMPESTGADLSRTGTIDTLVPIVKMKNILSRNDAELSLKSSVEVPGKNEQKSIDNDSNRLSPALLQTIASQLFGSIPTSEQDFKRTFDQYSDPVSYKQKFMDQNAFLVYYTQGFDGPSRPPLESSSDVPEKQTLQFGARNEAWVAWEELAAELQFATKNPRDAASTVELRAMVQATVKAFDSYLALAPSDDLQEALIGAGEPRH